MSSWVRSTRKTPRFAALDRSLALWLMRLVLLFSVLLFFGGFAVSSSAAAASPVLHARIDGTISHITADSMESALRQARDRQAQALLVELDTPGGLLDATQRIVRLFLDSEVPVVCFVSPSGARAGSAGVFLTLASHVAVMVPSARIGAAHPVGMFGGDVQGEMGKKVENDAVAWARSLAGLRGRNADWAEKAVRESASIIASEALANRVVDFLANDVPDLLVKLDGRVVKLGESREVTLATRGAEIRAVDLTGRQHLGNFLANPNLAFILVIIGIVGLFIEYQSPGLIVPGLVGGICLALVFGVQVLPVNWVGAVLILAALALLIAEIYIASFGLLAIVGLVLMVVGSYLLFDVPNSYVAISPLLIWGVALTLALVFSFLGMLILRTQSQGSTSGFAALAGEIALVQEPIDPLHPGRIRMRGSYWTAMADETFPAGAKVRVARMEGGRAVVERVPET